MLNRKNMWRGCYWISIMNGPTGERKHFERFTWEVWRGLLLTPTELSMFYWILVYEFTVLVNLYLFQSLFRFSAPYLRVCSLLRALWAPDWPVFGWEANPLSCLQNLPSHHTLSSVFFCLHIPTAPGPVSCSSSVRGPCEWVPEDCLRSHEGLLPPGLRRPSLSPRNPQAIHTSEL